MEPFNISPFNFQEFLTHGWSLYITFNHEMVILFDCCRALLKTTVASRSLYKIIIMCCSAQCLNRDQNSPLKRATCQIVAMCRFVSHNSYYRLHSYQSALYLLYYWLSSMHYNAMHFSCHPKYSYSLYIAPPYCAVLACSQDSQSLEAQFPLANLMTAFVSCHVIVDTSSSSLAL